MATRLSHNLKPFFNLARAYAFKRSEKKFPQFILYERFVNYFDEEIKNYPDKISIEKIKEITKKYIKEYRPEDFKELTGEK